MGLNAEPGNQMATRESNRHSLSQISKTLKGYGLDLPREHRRIITLIANRTNPTLAFKCAAAMHRDRKAEQQLSRMKNP